MPVGYTCPDGYRLGNWISDKRKLRDVLPEAGKAALDDRGMIWDARTAGTSDGPARPGTGQLPPAPAQPRPAAARDAAPDPARRHQEDPRP